MAAVLPFARPGNGPTDAALVVAVRGGEAWATEALFRRHAPMVNALALRLMGRAGDVDDLVQESYIEAYGAIATLKDPQAFAAWLKSIVVRTASKMLRRRRFLSYLRLARDEEPVDVDTLVAKTAPPDDAAELRALYRLIDGMPVKLRIPLLLRRVEAQSLEEIAELTGASLATVKRRIQAAEEMLEYRLAGKGGWRDA